jgi:hypothetical protein
MVLNICKDQGNAHHLITFQKDSENIIDAKAIAHMRENIRTFNVSKN